MQSLPTSAKNLYDLDCMSLEAPFWFLLCKQVCFFFFQFCKPFRLFKHTIFIIHDVMFSSILLSYCIWISVSPPSVYVLRLCLNSHFASLVIFIVCLLTELLSSSLNYELYEVRGRIFTVFLSLTECIRHGKYLTIAYLMGPWAWERNYDKCATKVSFVI